jgi:hypothetical protein
MILETWDRKEQEQIETSRKKLQGAYAFISRKADGLIQPALNTALHHWGLVNGELKSDATNVVQRAPSHVEFTDQVSACTR